MRRLIASLAVAASLAACSADSATGPDLSRTPLPAGLSARAASRVLVGFVENLVEVKVIVTNESTTPVTYGVGGGCPVTMRLYREGSAQLSFENGNRGCILSLRSVTLAPGRADTVADVANVSTIVPRGTRAAPYRVEAVLGLYDLGGPPRSFVIPAGQVTIP